MKFVTNRQSKYNYYSEEDITDDYTGITIKKASPIINNKKAQEHRCVIGNLGRCIYCEKY